MNQKAPQKMPGSMTSNGAQDHPNADQESKVEFHSQTVLVQLPVVVCDKQGHHVSNLTRGDFEVLENGKTQKIATFEEVTTANRSPVTKPQPPDFFSNSFGSSGEPHNLVVVVLDTVNTPFLDQAYGRKQLVRYLATNLVPGQSFALVALTAKGIQVIQAPTQDSTALVQAVNHLQGELSTMEDTDIDTQAQAYATSAGNLPSALSQPSPASAPFSGLRDLVLHGDSDIARLQQDRAIEATLRGFLDISWALSGIAGRKSMIWATGGFPFYIDSPGAIPGHEAVLYERTMQALNDSQIAVYPVDLRGLLNTSPGASSRGLHGPTASQQLVARTWLQSSTIDTLRDFAEMTGGVAFHDTNDIAGSFQRAIADSAAYYLVSYYLDTANRNPGWRKLKVKVNRKGVDVRSRNGFFVTNTTVNPSLTLKLDLNFAVNSPFDSTGVPLSVQWTGGPATAPGTSASNTVVASGTTDTGKKTIGFLLRVPGNGVSIEPGSPNRFNVDLLAYAFDDKQTGAAANFAKNFDGALPDAQLPTFHEKGLGYRNTLDLAPGKYTVRFVVRDNLSGRVGSLSAPVTVN